MSLFHIFCHCQRVFLLKPPFFHAKTDVGACVAFPLPVVALRMFAFSLAFLKRMNILEVIYVPSASAQTPSATARNSEGFTSVYSERISGAGTVMLFGAVKINMVAFL